MSALATYRVEHLASSLESLAQLDAAVQRHVTGLLNELGEYVDRYPHRTHRTEEGVSVYRHPEPDVEVAYVVDDGRGVLTCIHVAAPLPRKVAFVSYSHKNRRLFEEFKEYVYTLQQQGRIQFWHDETIAEGREWEADLQNALNTARAAVLLVSQAFLSSEYIRTKELPVLERRFDTEHVLVFWIPLEHCTYEDVSLLRRLQALGDPQSPLTACRRAERRRRMTEISRTLKRALIGDGDLRS